MYLAVVCFGWICPVRPPHWLRSLSRTVTVWCSCGTLLMGRGLMNYISLIGMYISWYYLILSINGLWVVHSLNLYLFTRLNWQRYHEPAINIKKNNPNLESIFTFTFISSLIHKHVQFVELLNVRFNLGQFLLIFLFSALKPNSVHNSHMCQFLILKVYLIPFPLQSFPNRAHFFLWQAFPTLKFKILLLVVLFMQVLNHLVLGGNVLLNFLNVLWHLAVVLFLQVVHRLLGLFRCRQDVLDGICYNEILSTF